VESNTHICSQSVPATALSRGHLGESRHRCPRHKPVNFSNLYPNLWCGFGALRREAVPIDPSVVCCLLRLEQSGLFATLHGLFACLSSVEQSTPLWFVCLAMSLSPSLNLTNSGSFTCSGDCFTLPVPEATDTVYFCESFS
jgi:hypothetical protein